MVALIDKFSAQQNSAIMTASGQPFDSNSAK